MPDTKNEVRHAAEEPVTIDILVSVLAGVVSRGNAAALLSTGTGILLVVLLQALTVPLDSPLPWMGGAVFMAPGLMLLFSQSELLGSSSIDEGPDRLQHVKSVVTGIIAGLLLQIPLDYQIIITPATSHNDPLPFSPYFLVYLLIVVTTMAGTGMIVNRILAAPIIMITVCLIGAWFLPFRQTNAGVNSNAMMILLFGTIVLSVTVPLRLKEVG